MWPEWLSGQFNGPKQMAAMYAMKEMANRVGDSATEAETTAYYNAMASARVTWGKYVRNLYPNTLSPNELSSWEDWGNTEATSPIPVGGYLDADNDWRQPYDLDPVAYADTRQIHPFHLFGYHPFYTEFSNLVKNNLSDELDDFIKAIEMYNPWWFMGDYSHQVSIGKHEEDSFSPIAASDIFQAQIYIFDKTFDEMVAYLPYTFEHYDYRDIFRLQNLVALLRADYGTGDTQPPAPPTNLQLQ